MTTGSCDVQSVFKGLHKVPFDNMSDYLQRKQERMENDQTKKGPRRRARRWNKGKKRLIEGAADNGDAPKRTMLDEEDDEEGEEEVDDEMEAVEANS